MKPFMDKDFLLSTPVSRELFGAAQAMPIFDWHCHLSPGEIYENKTPGDIAELWLGGDHYKWRAMRSCGVEEKYITGDAGGYEKFMAWAGVVPNLIGNPLYHWTHLELQRYFNIYEPLNEKTAQSIWERANAAIAAGGFTPRELIDGSNVVCLCTTDDAADSLEYHRLLAGESGFKCRVLPAFRPDKALGIELEGYAQWIKSLERAAGSSIGGYEELTEVLLRRLDLFDSLGCRASDHAFTVVPYARAGAQELELIFKRAVAGERLSAEQVEKYKTELMLFFAKEYARRGWSMEIHIGAMRNNNSRRFAALGPDTGYDSIADYEVAHKLSRLLDSLEQEDALPKTVLFALNPKDNYVLGSMLGNFQSDTAASKLQFGSAWWFNDNIDGMTEQMKALGNLGALSKFVGMVTDSRSLLSYPRHEYFRRILCELIGAWVDGGLYPADMDMLKKIVCDISYNNAAQYFGI